MQISIESPCCQNYGICGEQYISDLRFDDEGNLVSTRLRVMTKPLRNSADYIRSARETRMAMNYVMDDLL
jgi:Niemann-Pick C1 protein